MPPSGAIGEEDALRLAVDLIDCLADQAAALEASAPVRGVARVAVAAVRSRLMREIGRAFSTIRLANLAGRIGLSEDDAKSEAKGAGWSVDGDLVTIPASAIDSGLSAEAAMPVETLRSLTSYVSSLERPAVVGDPEAEATSFLKESGGGPAASSSSSSSSAAAAARDASGSSSRG